MRLLTLRLAHVTPRRSSVAFDLLASAPRSLKVSACEQDLTLGGGIRAVLDRNALNPRIVEAWAGSPPRGHYDLWETGIDLLIEDNLQPRLQLDGLRDDDSEKQIGLVCLRPCETELGIITETLALGCPPGWFILLLRNETCMAVDSTYSALGPVAPVLFHDRPNRQGKLLTISGLASAHMAVQTTQYEVTDKAASEGKALWDWLLPELHLARQG